MAFHPEARRVREVDEAEARGAKVNRVHLRKHPLELYLVHTTSVTLWHAAPTATVRVYVRSRSVAWSKGCDARGGFSCSPRTRSRDT